MVMGLVAAVVAAMAATGYASSVTRVTGGGQYFTDGAGADDTLTFEVQQSSSGQTFGEVEFDPTNSQSGEAIAAERWHGNVTCATISTSQGTAYFGGEKEATSSQGETEFFEIYLKDNPPHGGDDDVIAINHDDDDPCDEDVAGDETDLFRGEAQITTNGQS